MPKRDLQTPMPFSELSLAQGFSVRRTELDAPGQSSSMLSRDW